MRRSKKLIASLLLACATLTAGAQDSENTGTWGGLRMGYGTRIESPSVGVMAQTWLADWARIEIGVNYFFDGNKKDLMDKEQDATLYDLTTDVHFVLPLEGNVQPYAVAGATVAMWNINSSLDTHLGPNLGAGLDLRVSPKTRIDIEWHHHLVKDYGQSVFTLGAVFKF